MTRNRCLERERQRQRQRERGKSRGNNSCHFSDQYFLPSFLCKHLTVLSQNKNGIIQYKN